MLPPGAYTQHARVTAAGGPLCWETDTSLLPATCSANPVVGKLISQQSQISTVRLKFLLRAKIFKLKLLLMPFLQNRLAQAIVFCERATLKELHVAVSRSLLTTNLVSPIHLLDISVSVNSSRETFPDPNSLSIVHI